MRWPAVHSGCVLEAHRKVRQRRIFLCDEGQDYHDDVRARCNM